MAISVKAEMHVMILHTTRNFVMGTRPHLSQTQRQTDNKILMMIIIYYSSEASSNRVQLRFLVVVGGGGGASSTNDQ